MNFDCLCKDCSEALLSTYHHCLNLNDDLKLPSLKEILEDAKQIAEENEMIDFPNLESLLQTSDKTKNEKLEKGSSLPKIDAVGITTSNTTKLKEEFNSNRNSTTPNQTRRKSARKDLTDSEEEDLDDSEEEFAHTSKPLTIQQMSGAYKQKLLIQKNEIVKLKQQINSTLHTSESDDKRVQKLSRALTKAVDYCKIAAKRQANGQKTIDALYLQISSMMAFIINEQNEMVELRQKLDQTEKQKQEKISENEKLEVDLETIQDKLHHTYQDLIEMNEIQYNFREKTKQDAEVVRQQNVILRSKVEQLSKDYETSQKNNLQMQKQVEEMNQAMKEVKEKENILLESNRSLELQLTNSKFEYEKLKKEKEQTVEKLKMISKQKEEFENEVNEVRAKQMVSKNDFDETVAGIEKDRQIQKLEKETLQRELETLKQEHENTLTKFQQLQKECDLYKQNSQLLNQQSDLQVQKIKDLETTVQNQKSLLDQNEVKLSKTFAQLNDYKQKLEKEHIALQNLNTDFIRLKQNSSAQITMLEEEMIQNENIKTNLIQEKKNLLETIRNLKVEVDDTKALVVKAQDELRDVKRDCDLKLNRNKTEKQLMDVKMRKLEKFEEKFNEVLQLEINKRSEVEESLLKTKTERNQFESDLKTLKGNYEQLNEIFQTTKQQLDEQLSIEKSLNEQLTTAKSQIETKHEIHLSLEKEKNKEIKENHEQIQKHQKQISELQSDLKKSNSIKQDLIKKSFQLLNAIAQIQHQQRIDQHEKLLIENQLSELRLQLMKEKEKRRHLEEIRFEVKFNKQELNEQIEAIYKRAERLLKIENILKREFNHLCILDSASTVTTTK